MRPALLIAIAALLSATPSPRRFTGKITDNMCARGDHRQMQMGADDAECTIACVRAHGALYVLWDGKRAYELSDQDRPEKFAGKKVTVTGTLDATGNIHVANITAN